MAAAWKTLGDLGAVDETGRLTALGRHMVRRINQSFDRVIDVVLRQSLLPLDLRLSKVLKNRSTPYKTADCGSYAMLCY